MVLNVQNNTFQQPLQDVWRSTEDYLCCPQEKVKEQDFEHDDCIQNSEYTYNIFINYYDPAN